MTQIGHKAMKLSFASLVLSTLWWTTTRAQSTQPSAAVERNPAGADTAALPVSQQTALEQVPEAGFKVTTRMVVVDVVARDKKDHTVNDLSAADFSLRENGKEQTIRAFSFRHPGPLLAPTLSGVALPPHVFTNTPHFQSNSALNVILLDGLNSTLLNQAYVRVEMVKFLERLPQGQPIAIYGLGQKLRLLQDFTTDLTELKKVIQAFKGQSSHAMSSPTGTPEVPMTLGGWAEQTALEKAPHLESQINAFAQDDVSNQTDIRIGGTVAALTALTRTLAGYPGRKNLIWITESVPVHVFGDFSAIQNSVAPDGSPVRTLPDFQSAARARRDYENQLALIANLLADAQVAVYPIDARGLIGSPLFNAANNMSGQSAMGGMATHAEGRQSEELFEAHSNMLDIAEKTGGKAYFNRNDLDQALLTDMDDGSTYYSLSYYPEDKNWDGKFRKIQITSKHPGIKLRYRLGYFAVDRAAYMKDHPRQRDMELDLALNPNSPVATALQFQVAVRPPSPQTNNKVLLNYAVDPHTIRFERTADGLEHAELDCAARVFLPANIDKPVKSEGTRMTGTVKPEVYDKITATFFPCQLYIDLLPGSYLLRLAVRDNLTGLLGAVNARVEVPANSASVEPKPANHQP